MQVKSAIRFAGDFVTGRSRSATKRALCAKTSSSKLNCLTQPLSDSSVVDKVPSTIKDTNQGARV
jgi:hypothetical protein